MDIQKILQLIPNSVSGDGKTFVAALKNYLSKYGTVTDEKIDDALEELAKKPAHVTSITLLELHAITDGVRSNNIQVAWDITPVEDYAKAEVWYKTGEDDSAWQKVGEASGTMYVYQGAATGATYYIRIVAVNSKGNVADFDTAPQASIKIKGSQYIPSAPTQFVLTWDEQGPLWKWLFEDNNYVDFFELRLDQNPGVWNDKRLDSTRETWSRVDPGVRAGTAYLYIRNIFGEYSEPAVHQFNKAQPTKPSAPVVKSTIDGVRIKMEPLPQGSTKYRLFIKTEDGAESNEGYFETVNSEYIYFFFTGTITVRYQFIDPLGSGEWSDEVTATVKAGVDISQIPTIGYDKVTDDIKNAIDIANKQPNINKVIDSSIANINNSITNINTDISDLQLNVIDIDGSITNIENNIKDVTTNISDIYNNINDITDSITDINGNITNITADIVDIEGNINTINTDITGIENNITNITAKITDIDGVIDGLDVSSINSTLAELDKQMQSNTSDIQQNAEGITAVVTRVTTVEREVEKQGTAINQTADSITSLAKRVTANEGKIDTNMSAINQTADSITSLVARVDNTDSNIDSLAQAVTDTATAIQQNADSITSIAKRVINTENGMEEHTSSIQQNADSITALVKRVTTAESGIEENTTAINQTADSITALAKRVTTNEGKISTNTSAIEQNAEGITALVTRVDGTEDTIEKQSTAIQQNADSITALVKRVTTAESGIEENTTAINQTADSITALAKRVTTNEGKISTNTSAIEQNAEGITALVTRVDGTEDTIEKQSTAIQQNADSITALAKRVTTTESGVADNTTAIQQTADSITALAKRVTTNEGKISTNTSAIEQNAEGITALVTRSDSTENDVNSLAQIVTTTATAVQQNADSITSIAKRVINTENGMEEHTSSIQQNADSITAVVKRVTTVEGTVKAQGTAINQTADSITALAERVTTNESKIDTNMSSVQQNADSIAAVVTRVTTVEGTVTAQGTAINQTADSITAVVTELNKDAADCNYSAISQLQDNILLSVKKDEVINAINISKEGIVIDGNKIHITGDTVFDNNVIVGGAIVADSIAMEHLKANSVSTAKIQANAITADKIEAGAITADKIETGAIEAKHLAANSVSADAIQAGSIIGDKIAANTITGSKLAAENIDLLGALAITGGNVKLSEEGLRLTGGDGSFTLFDSEGINYIDKSGIAYAQVKKMIIGKAYDGQYIKFAAPWAKPPTVLLSPMSIQVNDANYSTASLFLVCEATDVSANGFRVNNYLRLSSDSYNVVSIEKTDVPSSYTIEEMEQYWYGHYSYAYTFQCYSDVMKVAIPETAQYIEFSLQLTIVNPFSKTDSDSDTGRQYTYNSSISTNYPNANGGWTYLDNNKRTIIVQLIVGGKVLQEVTFTTSDTTASIVKNFLLSSSFNAGSTQAIIRVTWNYSLKTSEHGSWSTLYNGRDYIAKAACKCELKRTYYKFSASEAKIARGYAVFLVTDGSTNTYITETIVKVLIKYDEVPLSNATVLVSGITYTTSGDGYIEMSGSATTKYTFTYNAAPPIDAIVDFTDGVITTVNIAPADITCYIRVKYDDAIVANATVTINGEEKTTDSDGKVEISGLDKHSAEYTVSYKGDTTIITVNYVDGSITTAGLYSLQDGSKTWTWSEANNKVIDFTVPNGAHRIKAEAEVDFLEGVPAEENSASIKNASNNIVWGAGYSVTDDNGENYEHKDIESVIAVTPGKTYSLKFDCASTNGVTFSWGREIDKLTATVTDT